MPYVKISELPAATTPLAGTELVEVVQDGTSKQVAVAAIGGEGSASASIASVAITGETHTLTSTDNGKRILFNSASACVLTLPQQSSEALPEGFNVLVRNLSTGGLSVITEGSDTVTGGTTWNDPQQYATVILDIAASASQWATVGDLA